MTLTQLSMEFGVSEDHVRFTTCALFLGLCIGASFWGIASDVIGRRPAFNLTLFITGVFGLAAGGGPTWVGYVCAVASERPILTCPTEYAPYIPAWASASAVTCPSTALCS